MKFFLVFILIFSCSKGHIEFLSDYDHVIYDHTRAARSFDANVRLQFTSLQRSFNLFLQPTRNTIFNHDFIEINANEKEPIGKYKSLFYEGYLIDEPKTSYASGSIINGVFYGTISTSNGKYFIEPSQKYNQTHKSHSIIYHEYATLTNKTRIGCAKDEIHQRLGKYQKRDVPIEPIVNRYTKRSVETRELFPDNKGLCSLYVKIDPILYREVKKNEGERDDEKTTSFILTYLQRAIQSLNSIFAKVEFKSSDSSKIYNGLQFAIHKTKFITEDLCSSSAGLSPEDKKLCEPYLDVENFLNYVSYDDYSKFCLGYTFTARDFADGTLGLAWVANPKESIGGVCEKRLKIQGVLKSLNSGIVTLTNYNKRVPDAISFLTLAHEIGHNFGSDHDPLGKCSPGDSAGGNFIMFPQASSATKQNNRVFSECSLMSMGNVVHYLINNKLSCFIENTGSFCGNLIVEENEECDCGYAEDCKEKCCYDASSDDTLKCKLKQGECSPSQGTCCGDDCLYRPKDSFICQPESDCIRNVYCNGLSSFCPANDSSYFVNTDDLGDVKECSNGEKICINGACSGSICEKYGLEQCAVQGDLKDKKTNRTHLCYLACKGILTNGECKYAQNIGVISEKNPLGFQLRPGSPCSGNDGYCDVLYKCRGVDGEGPLKRIRQMLSDGALLNDAKSWITKNWWAILLMSIGVVIFMVVFVKVCSRHTPSSNPKYQQKQPTRIIFSAKTSIHDVAEARF